MSDNLNFIGKNIRFFRRSRNWTLADLSAKIGIREGPLGRIERGINLPSAAVIYSLTQALDVPADALFAPELTKARAAAADTDALFTAVDEDPAIPPKPLLSVCHQLMIAFHALEDILGVQKHAFIPLCLPFDSSYPGMEHLSARVRTAMGTGDAVVFDYLELFENFGLRILVLPFMKAAEGFDAVSFYEPFHQNAFFFINAKKNPEKQLFSLATELGKILIFNQIRVRKDALFPDPGLDSGPRPITPIRAARHFAATFLAPAPAVRATVGQLGITPTTWTFDLLLRIKHRFGISAEAFLYRLLELNLITGPLSATFKTQIQTHYHQTGFGEPDNCRRILNANGRFFDLLTAAAERTPANPEIEEITVAAKEFKLVKM